MPLCAPAALRAGAHWLGVTSVEEGVAARAICREARILVISGAFAGQGDAVLQHRLTVVAWEPWQLDELESAAVAAHAGSAAIPVHLELDTGMSRQGVALDHLAPLLARFEPESPLKLEGMMTHLFAADEANGVVTREQLTKLAAALEQAQAAGIQAEWLNVGNSAAVLSGQAAAIGRLAKRHGMKTLMRPGLALYGLAPGFNPAFDEREPAPLAAARSTLQPVLVWKTRIVGARSIPAGAVVGYNGTFVASDPMRVALLAVGYADGLDRKLGNRFSLLVRGQRAPLVGRISMDQAVLDVTNIPNVSPGDEVVILGSQDAETITAFDHAEACGTIPWEVFTRISARVPRVAV